MKRTIVSLFTLLVSGSLLQAQTLKDGLRALDFERYEGARNIFKQLTIAEPTKGDNFYYLGQAYLYNFKPDSAKWAYAEGLKADPNNGMNYVGLGELLLADNKIPEAKTEFAKALSFSKAKDGSYTDAKMLRLVADALVSTDNKIPGEALTYITRAIELDKTNYNIMITAGDVYLERNEGGPAASHYEKAIDLDKNNPKAYTKVSIIWLRVRNAEATLEALNKALAIDPNYAPALKALSELYYQSKKFDKAKENYVKYLQNSEESSANKLRFAQILFRSKEYDEALSKVNEILAVDKSNLYLFRMKGYSGYEVASDKKDQQIAEDGLAALTHFMSNIDPAKVLPSDYEYMGKLYSLIPGKDSLALVNFNKVLELDSTKIEMYPEIAKVNNKLRNYNEAGDNYTTYISKKSNPTVVDYYLMGKAYIYGQNYGKADTAFMKVAELRPDYAEAYYYRGIANAGLDPDFKTPVAKDFWEKYLTLTEPTPEKFKKNLVSTYSYLADYYIKNDNNAKAKEYYNKVLTLEPENKTAKERLKQLK